MKKILTYATNHKGVTLVLMALMLAVLIVFASLAIDISYMYFTKNQLQVAADAAALAGAAVIFDTSDLSQIVGPPPARRWEDSARAKAIEFARKNKADRRPVLLETDNSNTLSNGNDITVGNWDRANNPPYTPGVAPVNAIEVKPKKWEGLSGSRGPVRLFLGPVFKALAFLGINADWTFMETSSYAVATVPLKASTYFTLCELACYEGLTSCIYPLPECTISPRILSRNPGTPNDRAFAWTSLLDPVTSTPHVQELICETTPYVDVCGHTISTTQGESAAIFVDFESVMFDVSIDSGAKECRSGAGVVGSCVDVIGPVVGWTIIVPVAITDDCPPAEQPDPLVIYGYAKIHVIAACGPGSSGGCQAGIAPSETCEPCSGPVAGGKCIIIDKIQCISCADAANQLGLKPSLVK